MTIKNLTIFLFTISTTISFAQSTLNLGIKGGANYAGFHSGENTGDNKFGINAGAIFEFQFSDIIALQTEFTYAAKGGTFNIQNELAVETLSVETELNYFDIPLLVKLYPTKNFSIDLGPQISFLGNSKGTFTDTDGVTIADAELTNVNKTDFALNAGFTVKLSDRALLQARYSHGMNEVFEDESYKNSVISVSLGYYFYKVGFYR